MIDLHIHTVHSDGFCSASEVLHLAEQRNISLISITDHNNISAYSDIKSCRRDFSGRIIPGIEINTTFDGEIIEILGYGIDLDVMSKYAEKNFVSHIEKRRREYAITLDLYKNRGIVFDENNLNFDASETPKFAFFREIVRHPENDSLFIFEDSKCDKTKFMRNETNNPDSPFFVDMSYIFPSIDDVISIIHNAGGLAFLAHTYAYTQKIWDSLNRIVPLGLDGLECIHSSFTAQQCREITSYCDAHSLLKSGGSDFHGEKYRPQCVLGGLNIPDNFSSDWTENILTI